MADIISLSKARKAKAQAERKLQAEANRLSFGRTKAEKQKTSAEKALSDNKIDGHKRDE